MSDAVGRVQEAEGTIDPFRVRALAAMLGVDAPGDALPLPWHWAQLPEVPGETGADGHPVRGAFLPDVGLPRRMWAASEIAVARPLRVGVPARRRSTIAEVRPTAGRSGSLCFVTVEHAWTQDGADCLTERQTIVYREAPAASVPAPPSGEAAARDDRVRVVVPDPVMLFRYSALTYNAHRIHYDLPYAREVEGYPGLVVHGPLIATLLLAAAVPAGAQVASFSFRAERPAFAGYPLALCATRAGDRVEMVSVDAGGGVTMRAEARLG